MPLFVEDANHANAVVSVPRLKIVRCIILLQGSEVQQGYAFSPLEGTAKTVSESSPSELLNEDLPT